MPRVTASPSRCLAVWLLLGVVVAGPGALLLTDVAEAAVAVADGGWDEAPFEQLLAWLAATGGAVALGWLWLVAGLVALSAARGAIGERVPGCPRVVRRMVLAACGVALGAGLLPGPAYAEETPQPVPLDAPGSVELAFGDGSGTDDDVAGRLDGLPLPDRPRSVPPGDLPRADDRDRPGRVAPLPAPDGDGSPVVVRRGDCLWDLAAADLAGAAGRVTDAQVEVRWREIHRLNAEVIGADPDLVLPGQRLRMRESSPAPDERNQNETDPRSQR